MNFHHMPELQNLFNEISNPGSDLPLKGYPRGFIDPLTNSEDSSLPINEVKRLASFVAHT
jgi:hypothetical protein